MREPATRRGVAQPMARAIEIKGEAMNDSVLFNSDGETAAQTLTVALTRQGFRVVRTFDLRSALAARPDRETFPLHCDCPYHGTDRCTCQFVVLLVYGNAAEPVVVTVHSRDTQAHLQIVHDALTRPDPRLARQVMVVLIKAALARPVMATRIAEAGAHVG